MRLGIFISWCVWCWSGVVRVRDGWRGRIPAGDVV